MISENVLLDVGLTNAEAKIYVCLLELGSTTVTNIAEKTKIHRTNVYDSLKKLVDKGVVSVMKQDNIAFYDACNPSVFISLLKEKESNFRKVLPNLLLLKKLADNDADYSLFKGVSSFIDSLHELLNYDADFFIFGMSERAIKLLGARIFPFVKTRIEKKIILKQIFSVKLKKLLRSDDSFTFTKFLSVGEEYDVSCVVCGDEFIITDWSGDVNSLRIKNKLIASFFRDYFNTLWNSASE